MNDVPPDDPRLAHTGVDVLGREIIDDSVLLGDFESLLEAGEENEGGERGGDDAISAAKVWELLGFIDRHGRQLLWLAKKGAGLVG